MRKWLAGRLRSLAELLDRAPEKPRYQSREPLYEFREVFEAPHPSCRCSLMPVSDRIEEDYPFMEFSS